MSELQSATLDGQLVITGRLTAYLSANVVTVGGSDADVYTGSYQVEPEVYAQELQTEGKLMTDNVTIRKIRKSETRNAAGGFTCVIGGN